MERSLLWKSLQAIARIWTTLQFELKTYDIKNVPKTGGVMLVCNHQSNLDPIVVAVHLRRPVSYMAKKELFDKPGLGWLCRALNGFPVERGTADIAALRQAIRRLEEGYALNLYPEGTRTQDGQIGTLQKGISLILRKSDCPVIPVAIDGSFQAWPGGRKLFASHPIHVLYGKPMSFKGMDADEILRVLDQTLRELLARLRREKPLDNSISL